MNVMNSLHQSLCILVVVVLKCTMPVISQVTFGCSGYTRTDGTNVPSFWCPRQVDPPNFVRCCSSANSKSCCQDDPTTNKKKAGEISGNPSLQYVGVVLGVDFSAVLIGAIVCFILLYKHNKKVHERAAIVRYTPSEILEQWKNAPKADGEVKTGTYQEINFTNTVIQETKDKADNYSKNSGTTGYKDRSSAGKSKSMDSSVDSVVRAFKPIRRSPAPTPPVQPPAYYNPALTRESVYDYPHNNSSSTPDSRMVLSVGSPPDVAYENLAYSRNRRSKPPGGSVPVVTDPRCGNFGYTSGNMSTDSRNDSEV